MSIGSISNLASTFIQSLPAAGVTGSSSARTNSTGITPADSTKDTNHLSPLGQIVSELQQLQQSNPAQYQSVTKQISTNLQTAAQTATSQGNTGLASDLTQLSADFATASSTGQLPNIKDLAQGTGLRAHHHHRQGQSSIDPSSGTTQGDPTTALSRLLNSAGSSQDGTPEANPLNPIPIILQTLGGAGIESSK